MARSAWANGPRESEGSWYTPSRLAEYSVPSSLPWRSHICMLCPAFLIRTTLGEQA